MATSTIEFLPNRLNRPPVVFRGMTGGEVALMALVGAAIGAVPGIVSAMYLGIPMVPTGCAISTAAALWFGGAVLRRLRRGRPDTWLYRKIQWDLARRGLNGAGLITESAVFRTRRDKSIVRSQPNDPGSGESR